MSNISLFQEQMLKNNIAAYIVTISDYHNSEYVSEHFKTIQFLTGFTGSTATLIVLKKSALLWVDGRYYIQAEKQVNLNEITIMKASDPNTPSVVEFLNSTLRSNDIIAFNGKTINANIIIDIKKNIKKHTIQFNHNIDLIDNIWSERPKLPFSIIYKLDTFFSGSEYEDKLADIHKDLNKLKADIHILSSLEDQAWLYNLRANDIENNPVFLAHSIITNDSTILFVDTNKIDLTVDRYLNSIDVIVKPYNEFYDYLKTIKGKNVLVDLNKLNYYTYSSISEHNNIINSYNPTTLLKCIKNKTEIKNIKLAHIKDGAAFVKFMYYVKESYNYKNDISELSLTKYLDDLRKENPGYIEKSFNTICAFNTHAAMMHYTATPESDAIIDTSGFLLVDSGAHYLEGTTDITRTIVLGDISKEMKLHFTTVLKSVIALSKAKFLDNCTGGNLDVLARAPIWDLAIDYKCGTGHGVGYLSSVHEGPNAFRCSNNTVFVPGMITTNEPGIYLENKYGIRTENELLCVEHSSNDFGNFLCFETLTFAPIDLDGIDIELLSNDEKQWLNNYHKQVYEIISPSLSNEEQEWLRNATREI